MKTKTIEFTEPRKVNLVELDVCEIAEDEVLVRIEASAISAGTERANYVGEQNVSIIKGAVVSFPRYSGYSSSGVVEKVGKAVTDVNVGDRVALSWSHHKKHCIVKAGGVYKLPDNVGFHEASLIHISTFPLAAIRKCRLEVGESALVMGLGVLGLIGVELLRASGAYPIIAVDPIAEKRERALSLGADYALNPFDEDFADKVKEITDGGAHVCLEITGLGSGLDMALDCMRKFGRVALLGCTRNSDFSIDYYRKVHGPGITMIGAHTMARPKLESSEGWWTERDDAKAVISLISGKRLDFKALIDEVHSPNECVSVYERLGNEKTFPTVIFDWSDIE